MDIKPKKYSKRNKTQGKVIIPLVHYSHKTENRNFKTILLNKTFTLPKKCTLVLTIIHISGGCCALALGITSIVLGIGGFYYGAGFWGGALFVTTGILGYINMYQKNVCTMVPFIVLSSLSMLLGIFITAVAAIGITNDTKLFRHMHDQRNKAVAIHSLTLLVALVEIFVSVISLGVCFTALKAHQRNKKQHSRHSEKLNMSKQLTLEENMPITRSHNYKNNINQSGTELSSEMDSSMAIVEDDDPFGELNISIIYPVEPTKDILKDNIPDHEEQPEILERQKGTDGPDETANPGINQVSVKKLSVIIEEPPDESCGGTMAKTNQMLDML